MGLQKQYLQMGKSARDRLFSVPTRGGQTPLSMLISNKGKINHIRLTFILFGIFTLAIGILLSSIPWLDYFILKNLRLWNGTLSYHYWQKPGVVRLSKVYIFNMTNPDGFLNHGEKPKLMEVGPFVYREEMEKVNIKFHDNFTVQYQHHKILKFVPELSVDKSTKVLVPNIPLLTLSTLSLNLGYFLQKTISLALLIAKSKPFVSVTADELVFGYDDTLVSLAHTFYPKHKRPMSKMGLLIGRNGTLSEVSSIHTGHSGMQDFGYLDKLNGLDHLPYWKDKPCNNIRASEGSFFPPRDFTKSDVVYVYDKDLCRILPLKYRGPSVKNGIKADLYTPPSSVFDSVEQNADNKCYCPDNDFCPPKGLQNISPCQYDAPVYLSFPHFLDADPLFLDAVEGLKPDRNIHGTYFKIQPKLGVPLEGKVRVQLNLRVEQAKNIASVNKFPNIVYPVMWIEEGVADLPPNIRRWIYLATTFGENAEPCLSYGLIITGAFCLIGVFVSAYKNFVFTTNSIEILEMGKRSLRRGSKFIENSQHKILMHRESYTLLNNLNNNEVSDEP